MLKEIHIFVCSSLSGVGEIDKPGTSYAPPHPHLRFTPPPPKNTARAPSPPTAGDRPVASYPGIFHDDTTPRRRLE